MRRKLFITFLVSGLSFLCSQQRSLAQLKNENTPSGQGKVKSSIIAHISGEPGEFLYDAGTVRFLVTSEDTKGAWSLIEIQEMPGYKTNLHRHNNTDEAFYVLEGVLTVYIDSEISQYPAGSYVLIPRGTPHAQGNQGSVPARLLLTIIPGGFEKSFKDRVELFKTIKPDDPDFRKKRKENSKKGNYDVEFLADWNLPVK